MIKLVKNVTETRATTQRPSPDAELYLITFACGHTIRSWRSGGAPFHGDTEPCPTCGK